MSSGRIARLSSIAFVLFFCLSVFLTLTPVAANWQKMDPPPDVDKKTHGHNNCPTCWLAAASNMLAGAGYGSGSTVQARGRHL